MTTIHPALTVPVSLETSSILPIIEHQRRSSALSFVRKRLGATLLLNVLLACCVQTMQAQSPESIPNERMALTRNQNRSIYGLPKLPSDFASSSPAPRATQRSAPALEISFCKFDLPDLIKQAHASFSLIYSFEVDDKSRAVSVHKVIDDYVGEEKVAACISQWRFYGVAIGAKMIMSLRWEHGRGWVELTLAGADFSQVIRIKEDASEIGAKPDLRNRRMVRRTSKTPNAEILFDATSSPLGLRLSSTREELLLSNRSSRTLVQYGLGCVRTGGALRLVRKFPLARTNLKPGNMLINSVSLYRDKSQICSQRKAKLAVAELRFQDGYNWRISSIAPRYDTAAMRFGRR